MDYRDSSDEADFRAGLREWLQANVPAGWRGDGSDAMVRAVRRDWHRSMFRAGYLGLSWPQEYGGRGLSPVYDAILNDELAHVDAPHLLEGINYLGRAIWTFGSDDQKARFLPPLLDGSITWCQGFSEPEAGSDIGSLRTRAVRDGDEYLVNGQKLWTSGAHAADWCLLLARTDSAGPKHAGISCFLLPLNSDGVETRPVFLASGEAETSEMFLDNVRVPAANMLGQPGDGWRIAMLTFSYERGPGDIGVPARYQHTIAEIEARARQTGRASDPAVAQRLAEAYVRGEALRLIVAEQLSARIDGTPPGLEASVAKLVWIDAEQFLMQSCLNVVGAYAVTGTETSPDSRDSSWLARYFSSRAISVYGGSEQIQLNIVAQRILDMPRG